MMRCLGCMTEYEKGYIACPYCGYKAGTQTESPLHMSPGSNLAGRYIVGKAVGYGGFGVTYIGWDSVLQQRIAIKEYLPSEFATRAVGQSHITVFGGSKAEQFADGMVKFVDEAKRLAQFQHEEGIVHVYDSFEANNTAYIIMEYLNGETLTAYLDREGKVPVDRAIEMLTPVIQSLEAVHKAGIIHRDIAPDNIILTRDGQVKLIDFGAARYATTSHSRSLTVIIKPGYSPEEQYRSRGDQGPHTDVYALGAVLYRMVTGITPPDALERRAFFENKKKDILVAPSKDCKIKKNKENAILNAMNVRIEDRTPTADAFLRQLTSTTRVQRVVGKIKAIDLMKWPLWTKIVVPAGAATVAVLFALLFTGVITPPPPPGPSATPIPDDMTRVPSVINYSVGTAQERLDGQELVPIIGGREVSDTIPANMVLRQSISAGEIVEKRSSVELFISAAADPIPKDGAMPDVAYYTEAEAVDMLRQLGAVVTVEQEYSGDIAEGIVIRGSIGTGEPLAEGTEVTLYVSMGPDPASVIDAPGESDDPVGSDDPNEPVASHHPAVTLNRSALSLFVGDSVSLTASGGNGSYSWSSSNSSVVTVSNGSVSAVGRGSATITVSSDGKTASCPVTVQDYSLSLSETYVSMFAGESKTISASGAPSGATVSWSSSNSRVATVSNGRISAVASGSATVTAQFTSGGRNYSATCQVNVSETGITLSQYSISDLYVGGTVNLSASTSPSGQSVSWSSSNSSVVTVSNGRVTAVGAGNATITAQFVYGGMTYSERCSVTVTEVSVRLSNSSLSMSVGDSEYLYATTSPRGTSVSWSSSNSSVATVNSNGRVTANGAGSATITATLNYKGIAYTDVCYITVLENASVYLGYTSVTLMVGSDTTLKASVNPAGQKINWKSSDTSIATVDSNGTVTGKSGGTAIITASIDYNGKIYSDSCKVDIVSISLSPSGQSINVGGTCTVRANVSPSGASVIWESRNPSVATVSGNGTECIVTGVSAGVASIRVSVGGCSTTCTVTVIDAATNTPQANSEAQKPVFSSASAYVSNGQIVLSGSVTFSSGLKEVEIRLYDTSDDIHIAYAFDYLSPPSNYAPTQYSISNLQSKINARIAANAIDLNNGSFKIRITAYGWGGNNGTTAIGNSIDISL